MIARLFRTFLHERTKVLLLENNFHCFSFSAFGKYTVDIDSQLHNNFEYDICQSLVFETCICIVELPRILTGINYPSIMLFVVMFSDG